MVVLNDLKTGSGLEVKNRKYKIKLWKEQLRHLRTEDLVHLSLKARRRAYFFPFKGLEWRYF